MIFLKRPLRLRAQADSDSAAGGADRGDTWTDTDDTDTADERLGKTEETGELDELEPKKSALKTEADELKPEEKVEDKPKGKEKDSRIPAARHKEILDKERARREGVEAELAKYQKGGVIADMGAQITEAETRLIAMEKEYAKHMTDGDIEKASATMTQIRRTERAINEQTAAVREQASVARAIESVRFDTTVERLEALYPTLNIEHEDFDKEKTAEVLELKDAYQLKGYTPSAALQKAVKLIMPPETKAQETALQTEARVDPAAVERARKAAAVEKTTAAVNKTPASSARVGQDSDKAGAGAVSAKDAMKMSYKDFSALDEDSLARMRGDTL